jgi:pyruvate,water dikinase
MEWYEGELDRFSEQLRDNIENPKEAFYRQEMERFRAIFHKPVIYSSWDWTFTVEDAMHHAVSPPTRSRRRRLPSSVP